MKFFLKYVKNMSNPLSPTLIAVKNWRYENKNHVKINFFFVFCCSIACCAFAIPSKGNQCPKIPITSI